MRTSARDCEGKARGPRHCQLQRRRTATAAVEVGALTVNNLTLVSAGPSSEWQALVARLRRASRALLARLAFLRASGAVRIRPNRAGAESGRLSPADSRGPTSPVRGPASYRTRHSTSAEVSLAVGGLSTGEPSTSPSFFLPFTSSVVRALLARDARKSGFLFDGTTQWRHNAAKPCAWACRQCH